MSFSPYNTIHQVDNVKSNNLFGSSTLQKNLKEANEENRILIFALMRGAGGGAIAVAVVITWLQLQYSKQLVPSIPLEIVIVGLLFYLPSLNGMLLVKRNSKIKAPVFLLSFAMLLIIIGYFLNIEIANK